MNKYTTFIFLFILSFVAFIVLMGIHLSNIFNLVEGDHMLKTVERGDSFFSSVFTTPLIISALVAIFSSLAYRILGIVFVARNKAANDGEKALWIVGFVIMGFVTGIVFIILARSRKFVE